MFLDVFENLSRFELAMQYQRRTKEHPNGGVQETQGMEHRCRQRGHLVGLERHMRQDAPDRRQRRRGTAVRPLRGSGSAAGQDDDRRVLTGLRRRRLAVGGDQVGQRFIGAAGVLTVRSGAKCAQLAQRRLGLADVSGVLVVVNDQLGALTFRDLFDLRAGERAVEQDDARPDACAAEFCDREPAVVARQDRDTVAAAHPLGQQPVGDRVRCLVELPVGERAFVVDDRRAVGRAPGVERRQHADFAPLRDVGCHRGVVQRRLQPEGAGLDDLAEVVQLGYPTLGILLNLGYRLPGDIEEIRHASTLCDARRSQA